MSARDGEWFYWPSLKVSEIQSQNRFGPCAGDREGAEDLCVREPFAAMLAVLVRVVFVVDVRLRSRLWDRSVNVSPGVAALLLTCIVLVV